MGSKDTQFKVGQSGGPGRPKGARNKFSEAYVEAFLNDFDKHGVQVIKKVRVDKPEVWLKLAAMLVPKDLDLKHSGDVNVSVVNYADNDDQAASERIASNGSVPISLVE